MYNLKIDLSATIIPTTQTYANQSETILKCFYFLDIFCSFSREQKTRVWRSTRLQKKTKNIPLQKKEPISGESSENEEESENKNRLI